jgi:4-hydroxy-tetrahydrodipicolinate synthase
MKLTRRLCGEDFDILSGDDDKTFTMMTDREIRASGVISVASNVAPAVVKKMTVLILERRIDEATKLANDLKPLFEIVTVKTNEATEFGEVSVKARNPVSYKTLMNVLGMPAGPMRQPLGRMTKKGLQVVLEAAKKVYENTPAIFTPVEVFFNVDLSQRLYREEFWKGLTYD